jgi:hypothetical protein
MTGDDEAAGAGRFYEQFGWEALVRELHGWVPVVANPQVESGGG